MVPPDGGEREYVGTNVIVNLAQRGLVRRLDKGLVELTRQGEALELGPVEEEDAEDAEEDAFEAINRR